MKKGSKLFKCRKCGTPIFWTIPTDNVLGIQFVEQQKIRNWEYCSVNGVNGRYCSECAQEVRNVTV